jgi:hypothetical protein
MSNEGMDNITCLSKGPPAGCALHTGKGCGNAFGLMTRDVSPEIRVACLGRPPTPWRGGMRVTDCPGESRVRQNLTHGLGRGRWRRGTAMVCGPGRPLETAGMSATAYS